MGYKVVVGDVISIVANHPGMPWSVQGVDNFAGVSRDPIVANRPDLPGKVPLIRPCPVSRPTERSFNGLSRWLPS